MAWARSLGSLRSSWGFWREFSGKSESCFSSGIGCLFLPALFRESFDFVLVYKLNSSTGHGANLEFATKGGLPDSLRGQESFLGDVAERVKNAHICYLHSNTIHVV
jgi:hypothetical protein